MANDTSGDTSVVLIDSSKFTIPRIVSLYLVRNAHINEEFKVQAHFGDDIKFTFDLRESLDEKNVFRPFIYCLQIELAMDIQGHLFAKYNGSFYSIREYQLRISRKIAKLAAHHEDDKFRMLLDPRKISHTFLFDVNFSRRLAHDPPGANVPFWSQLCLFTYYLLRHHDYPTFDILIEQLADILLQDRRQLIRDNFNDFFETCFNCLFYALKDPTDEHIAVKIILRMIGLLPIDSKNFDLNSRFAEDFTIAMMGYVRERLEFTLGSITEYEWPLFRDGLIILMCIELLQRTDTEIDATNNDTLALLRRIPVDHYKQDLANGLLRQLEELKKPVTGSSWTELFTLVKPEMLDFKHLELTTTFDSYIASVTRIVSTRSQELNLNEKLTRNFDILLINDHFTLDLESILYLLEFVQNEPLNSDENSRAIYKIVRSAIESNIVLKAKIKHYLYTLRVTIEQLKSIEIILGFISKSDLLFKVDRKEWLIELLDNRTACSCEFYTKWFLYFLVPTRQQQQNDRDRQDYQELLKSWTNCFLTNRDILMRILMNTDELLAAFGSSADNDKYRLYFIRHMIDLCFQQVSIYRTITDGLLTVGNELFLEQFKDKFALEYISHIPPDRLKQMTNEKNPLYHLIELDKQLKGTSELVRNLIRLVSHHIRIDSDEILRDTFDQPIQFTCIYAILFEDCFRKLPIRQTTIDHLLSLWTHWEDKGLRADQIWRWKNYSPEERQVARRIWDLIGQIAKKQYQIDILIDAQQNEMQAKLAIKDKITTCLNEYCQYARDKQVYLDLLDDMQQQFKHEIVRSVQIPSKINALEPLADRLNSISQSNAWRTFLTQHVTSKETTAQSTTTTSITDDDWLCDNEPTLSAGMVTDRSTHHHPSLVRTTIDSNRNTMLDQRACIEVLEQAVNILDMFTARLKKICAQWKQSPILQLIELFPDMHYVDHDFRILQPLLDPTVTPNLMILLEYWKNRELIGYICQGCSNMIDHLQIPVSEAVSNVLSSVLLITKRTSGEKCFSAYHNYRVQYVQRYSEQVLNIIAHCSLSKELVDFLDSLVSSDVDNLLEAVNDWDETLINTKTVIDFVMLKTFFDRVRTQIELVRDQPKFGLDYVVGCFENSLKENEFKNILSCFDACSASLPSIKRVYMELTNKEQSKRRRILDIMQKSLFEFVHRPTDLFTQFDVMIESQGMQFSDLSELRDRARLIEYSNSTSNKLKADAERDIHELRSFVQFVATVEKTLKHLTALNLAGHPQFLAPHKKFTCIQGDYEMLIEFSSTLEILLTDWERHLCAMYERHIDLTYFSYQQVWMVEDYLYNRTGSIAADHAGYHLLKFIGIEPELIQSQFLPNKSNRPDERFANIGHILTAQRPIPGTSAAAIKRENRTIKKVFLVETSDEGILRAILSLFELLKVSIRVNHLFYCTEYTSWMEVRAFIYRCFYSQTLHQLIRPELLPASIQDQFTRLLRQLIEQHPQRVFRLGIITTVSTVHLQMINSLRTLQIVNTVHDQEMLDKSQLQETIRRLVSDNCILVTSRITGLGKSTFIRDEIHRREKDYIKFPISGDIDVDILAERLRQNATQLVSSKAALHIDIGAIDNVKQLNELLYCLLLFRSFRLGQIAVHVPIDVPIYIELDASPHSVNAQGKIVLFKHLQSIHLDSMQWDKLKVNSTPAIQWVTNYLQAMNDKTLLRQDINEQNIVLLDVATSIRLLKEAFLRKKNPDFVTWTQLSIFLAVYHRLFTGFSHCGHFLISSGAHPKLRQDLLQNLLNSSDQFTSLCVESVRTQQRAVNSNEPAVPFSEAIVRWDNTQPFTLVFTATDDPLFVYKKPDDVPRSLIAALQSYYQALTGREEEQQLQQFLPDHSKLTHTQFFLKLAALSKKYFIKSICTKCFNQFDYDEQQCRKCSTNDTLQRPASYSSEDIENFQKYIAEILQTQYVLTPDNYIKMLLIYLRVQSGLPVLIMGETGVGKTALIQFLCQKVLDDEMAIFRIHAGVTNEKIIETIRHYAIQAYECAAQDPNKRLWVFLDEFNTTPNIGLIKEITCERTLLGEPLPNNMVFLGACNPQRRKNAKTMFDDNIGIKKDRYEMQRLNDRLGASLLYTVVPIPETMLEYVWDYGYLDEPTESKYIKTMLNTCERLSMNLNWFNRIVYLIAKSQRFFRKLEDVSSVSLRDVARFCRLYNWFLHSIIDREGEEKFIDKPLALLRRASLTALLLCYYFRLNSPKNRTAYTTMIENALKPILTKIAEVPNFLQRVLQDEQMKLVQRMDLPPGTATNRALADNIFVLLTCILNRIPVIICGKPGCSKTSAIQIVISSLKGKKSKDPYFQILPELIAVSYQGSQNCTSESIIKVFERADKYTRAKSETELLPVIVFDEIGLAELSPHNPLKVLHSELEVETCQYGFVGLSNWRLDASKMNRALYLSCPDPDINDLQLTATIISTSMLPHLGQAARLDLSIIQGLAAAYFDLYEYMKKQSQHSNYFGLRDYYSLIKNVVRDAIQPTRGEEDPYENVRRQLIVNFDGILNGSEFMWESFCKHTNREHLIDKYTSPTFKQLLDQSLSSRTGRYLMLIGESESVIDYVERYIIVKHQPPPVRTLIGSSLPGDLISGTTYTEQYNYRVLMDIILYAETNVTLIMRRMGHLYDNLYDLFNQNFAISAQKKYCRIALGALYHPRCHVHDNFYCIVVIRRQDLAKCDPPFLNRFEKHIINMETLVHRRHWSITKDLLIWLADLLPTNINKYFPLLQHLFVDYSDDYICNLVIDAFIYLNISIDDENDENTLKIVQYCKEKLIRTSSFDLPLVLALQSEKEIHPLIQHYYDIHSNLSFAFLLDQTLKQSSMIDNQIIYTYTQLYQIIIPLNNDSRIEEMNLGNFKTELELTNKIKGHYTSGPSRLLLIRVDYHQEHEHILLLKHILLNERIETSHRGIWLIFHLQRNMLNQITNDVLFNGWSTVMIDDLNEHKLVPLTILTNPSYQNLVVHRDFLISECIFDELIDRCLTKFRYTVAHKHQESQINERRNRIIECLSIENTDGEQQHSLRSIVQDRLLTLMRTVVSCNQDRSRFNDWRRDLLTNGAIIGACRSFNDALQSTISHFYDNYLLLLFAHLEKHSLIDSFLFLRTQIHAKSYEFLYKIWFDCLASTLENIDRATMTRDIIEIALIFDLRLPCSTTEYEIIRQIRQIIARRDQNENDNNQELTNFAMKQMRIKSVYGSNIELILNNPDLFTYYYHDQLALAQDEGKIHQLSSSFVQRLLTTNTTRTVTDRLKHLILDYVELFEILRLFEIGIQLIGEDHFDFELFYQQFTIRTDRSGQMMIKNETDLYCLIWTGEHFSLISPRSTSAIEENFDCEGDPFIEIGLMNLIELLVSAPVIDRVNNIEQLTTAYGLIAQGILGLRHYTVNNLEKLCSFNSLVRCITALLPNELALNVFKQACRYAGFEATFPRCDTIHNFIIHLNTIIKVNQPTANDTVIQRTLLKLEIEFLKNWLADHGDQYIDILTLMNAPDNDLWQYSAKIFTYIDRKLNLFPMIKDNYGQLPRSNDEYQRLEEHLRQLNDSSHKIERLMVNRIHMHLMLGASEQEMIENILREHFIQFEENIRQIQDKQFDHGPTLIGHIAWLKFYAQLYAFALNNDSHNPILTTIDEFLTRDESSFCSTLKLFIIKQLCQMSSVTLNELRDIVINRNLVWIRPMIIRPIGEHAKEIRRHLVLPTPLFECREEFIRINNILTHQTDIDHLRQLIVDSNTKQESAYCFLLWFIHYYTRFYSDIDAPPDTHLMQLIERDLREELIACFEPIGYKLLIFLCTNFTPTIYFRLQPTMSEDELHRRLLALNILALFLSFKAQSRMTYLGNILFNGNLKMPDNYVQHLQTSLCLLGLISSDPILTQMIDVRTQVQDRLNRGQIHDPGKFIFQCSKDCLWTFYFVDCGVPVARSRCPLCGKDIGAEQYGILIARDPPQIQRTIDDGFQFITRYIEEYNRKARLGYHNMTSARQSNTLEKSDHLNRPVSYRFLHMLTHAILLCLHEFDLLTNLDLPNRLHFREHFEKDYFLLGQLSTDAEQCYIWLFKLINHMIDERFALKGLLNSNEKLVQLETLIERELIFTHIESVANEINQYKLAYAEFVRERNEEPSIDNFVDELYQNEQRFPCLNFFNITNIHTANPIDEFRIKLQTIPYGDKIYPITTFLLQRLDYYANIQYLYPIVTFTNHLIQKFNHRIKRNDAAETTIAHYLTHGPDCETTFQFYQQFIHAWYKLNLNEVRFNCQTAEFKHTQIQDDFAKNTKIAMVLLNTSKDDSSILLAACLRTIGELQNEIVNFFHNTITVDIHNNNNNERLRRHAVPVQAIRPEHILRLDADMISTKLITDGFTLNYAYGKSKDLIYDYEEIEMTLRNLISRLPLIDTEKLHFLNYQFELYGENTSLINDVRARVKQEPLIENERTKLKGLIYSMDNDDILHYLGSLDYVFTYLRNTDNDAIGDNPLSIQAFVERYIRSSTCLNDNILRRPPFATISLKYIIDLYELLEESAFDQVLRNYVKQELCEETFPMTERIRLVEQFVEMTLIKERIAPIFQNIHCWISMLKRLMVRVLSNVNVSLDVPLQLYLERTDLWTGNITIADIQTFEIRDDILLQHTYVILKGLEARRDKTPSTDGAVEVQLIDIEQQPRAEPQSAEAQILRAKTWHNNKNSNNSLATRVIVSEKGSAKKMRV